MGRAVYSLVTAGQKEKLSSVKVLSFQISHSKARNMVSTQVPFLKVPEEE